MEKGILYIQENKEFAERFRKRFAERGIQLFTAASAAEALDILRGQEMAVLLISCKIPGMRLDEFLDHCTRYPEMVVAVCLEEEDPLLVTMLVNRYQVRKLFPAPWDIDEIIEEIDAVLMYMKSAAEQKKQEYLFNKEKAEFEKILGSLTDALKKQQYSYYKLNTITQILLTQLKGMCVPDSPCFEEQYGMIEDIFTTMLKMRTTGTTNSNGFESLILHDMEEIKREYPDFYTEGINSCLSGCIRKAKVVNIRFALWLLAKCGAVVMGKCGILISSELLGSQRAVFEITLKGIVNHSLPDLSEQLVRELLDVLSVRWELENREHTLLYRIEFKTASVGEN
ncbi:MAG: hypothetical protein QM697_11295 [Lachnospiraceae bacterium]